MPRCYPRASRLKVCILVANLLWIYIGYLSSDVVAVGVSIVVF